MTANTLHESYIDITASIALYEKVAEKENLKFADIRRALLNKSLSPLRLESQLSASTIIRNQQINELVETHNRLSKHLANLILGLNELKNAPTKTLSEEEYQQRMTLVQHLTKDLDLLKKTLLELDNKITYLYDYNQDLQNKSKSKVNAILEAIDKNIREKAELIINYLKSANINIETLDFNDKLLAALTDPALQAAFMAESTTQPNKGFSQKLKEWFK